MLKKAKKNDVATSNNVAVGQAVALTLNILLDGCVEDASPLGLMEVPADGILCTIDEGEDCAMSYSFPESTWGLSAAEVLADLNKALAGQATTSGASLADLSAAADGFNNAYDECRTKVSCELLKPDLVFTDVAVTGYTTDSISYSYTVKNIGCSPANLDMIAVQAMLSDDEYFNNGGDVAAGGKVLATSEYWLAPDATISDLFTASVTNPADYNYLTFMVDWGDGLDEIDEGNNFAAAPIDD